jgi:hypothetical protein
LFEGKLNLAAEPNLILEYFKANTVGYVLVCMVNGAKSNQGGPSRKNGLIYKLFMSRGVQENQIHHSNLQVVWRRYFSHWLWRIPTQSIWLPA